MKKPNKTKQIVIRFDEASYSKISEYAEAEHRNLGEFVRHAALCYIELLGKAEKLPIKRSGTLCEKSG